MRGLGRVFDLSIGQVPVDIAAANGATGKRVHLKNYSSIAFVYICDAGTNGEDTDLDVQQHTAASGGTTADLDVVTTFYRKQEATLDGDETWTKVTQTAASEVDLGTDEGENEGIYVVEVDATSLSDGYEWVSLNVTDPGATAGKLACVLYILYGLNVQRAPENLAQPQA